MGIIGFNFTKVFAERNEGVQGQVNIKNNLAIKSVEKQELSIASKDQIGIKLSFEFSSKHEPNLGAITINANVLVLEPKEEGEKILKEWEKNKKLQDDFLKQTFTFTLRKCSVKALMLAEDLNLPSPVPLPQVKIGNAKEEN